MASKNKYKFFLNGGNISILSYNEETGVYLTPTSDESNAILIRYTQTPQSVSSETDEINVDSKLQMAIVYYVKFRLLEFSNPRAAEAFYNKFVSYVKRSENSKRTTSPVAIPTNTGALR